MLHDQHLYADADRDLHPQFNLDLHSHQHADGDLDSDEDSNADGHLYHHSDFDKNPNAYGDFHLDGE